MKPSLKIVLVVCSVMILAAFGWQSINGIPSQVMSGFTAVSLSAAQTTANCSTSGTVVFSQPFIGASFKQVEIYAAACLGTASYTYPTAFTNTPQVLSQSLAAVATSVSTSAVTVTGTTTTGFLKLDGY